MNKNGRPSNAQELKNWLAPGVAGHFQRKRKSVKDWTLKVENGNLILLVEHVGDKISEHVLASEQEIADESYGPRIHPRLVEWLQ